MKYELIDIHAHVNFNAFRKDGDEVVRRTLAERVGMILVGSQIDTSRRAVEYAERYPQGVWAAVGLHPIHVTREFYVDANEIGADGVPGFSTRPETFDYETYTTLAVSKKTVAVGECGLDYAVFVRARSERGQKRASTEVLSLSKDEGGLSREEIAKVKQQQHDTLREHIRLARKIRKPLIIHCRNAYSDLHAILKEERAHEAGGTIHFFAGTWEDAQKFLDLGFHLSFTGVITFARDYDETVKKAPLERIMVETDAPYVAPVPYRGTRNEPWYVREVAKRVAEIRGISFEAVAEATTANAVRLFRLQ